jgi:CHAT domain-containing protein
MNFVLDNKESLSLSSFFQATGFSNTITSLWEANDHSTSGILSRFYTLTGKNNDVTHALHEAKKRFLEKNKAQHASPLFWAHLRLTGGGGYLESTRSNSTWYLLILLVIPAYFIFRKRSSA